MRPGPGGLSSPGPPALNLGLERLSGWKDRHDIERIGINDHQLVFHDDVSQTAILRNDFHNRFGNIIKRHRIGHAGSDRNREIDVVNAVKIPAYDCIVDFGFLNRRQSDGPDRSSGPSLGLVLHRAVPLGALPIFLNSAGPSLGLALHRPPVLGALLFFLNSAGPSLGLALHRPPVLGALLFFLNSAGPSHGLALHRAGMLGALLSFPTAPDRPRVWPCIAPGSRSDALFWLPLSSR